MKRFELRNLIHYKIVFFIAGIAVLSALSFLLCSNTFMIDKELVPPIALWRGSGGNLLYFSDHIFLYNPVGYLRSRGLWDVMTVGLLWFLFKKLKDNYNELLAIYVGILAAIGFIVFNPIIVFLMIKVTGSSIPIYRSFGLVWPALSAFTICAALTLFKTYYKKSPFMVVSIALIALNVSLLFTYQYAPFLKAIYENHGNYYSTSTSPYMEPFSTLRTLEHGRIAVRTPLATPIAAFTNLDPITMDKFRSKSLIDWGINEGDNESLLSFNKSYEELLSIIDKRNIHYIMVDRSDIYAINNFRKYPELIRLKVSAGTDDVWEIHERHN